MTDKDAKKKALYTALRIICRRMDELTAMIFAGGARVPHPDLTPADWQEYHELDEAAKQLKQMLKDLKPEEKAGPVLALELKPCPFCGSKAEFQVSSPNWDGACNVRVVCPTDGCYANMLNGWQLNEMIAAEKWNKRYVEDKLLKVVCVLLDITDSLPDEALKDALFGIGLQFREKGEADGKSGIE